MPDPTTQSNYLDISSTHIALDWILDWNEKCLTGFATHHLVAHTDQVNRVVLDTAFLNIKSVEVGGHALEFTLGNHHEVMGRPLTIPLLNHLSKGDSVTIVIQYATTTGCTALQWIEKDQTAGKKFEFLFSQAQPIYARSMMPCQDTPSIKVTYNSIVKSVLPVVMSAIRVSPPPDGPIHGGKRVGVEEVVYSYNQPVPVPSYLFAIASGNLAYKAFTPSDGASWTTGVWTEPEMIDPCYWEFSHDTPRFISEAEKILIPYKFGVYDILVLPPSFPYGGMENACLTFLTPTLLSGDRALVDVIAHELTHSYFGNGVTHKDASNFWLNEGWTTYFERVLQHVIHGSAARDFSCIMGAKALADALKQYEDRPKYQRLIIDFDYGEDPDDAYSSIPYEKGAAFLLYLERILGGLDIFLPYARDYVQTFIGRSISTQDWKDHLYAYFQKNGGEEKVKILNEVDWDAWFYGEGLKLPVDLQYDTTLAKQAFELAAGWEASRDTPIKDLTFKASDLKGFNTNQITVFLEKLSEVTPLPATHIHHMSDIYGFTTTNNAEVGLRWYELALSSPAALDFGPAAANWIISPLKGRMKFCRPIFRLVSKVDNKLAQETYKANKTSFHPIARKLIEKDLGLDEVRLVG